jgi:hypothetical protein
VKEHGFYEILALLVVALVVASVFAALIFLYACCHRKAQPVTPRSLIRESILGAELMLDTQLAKRDIGPRWAASVAGDDC